VADLGSQAANEDVKPEIMREAVVMQMTWPGAPTIYYGDEAGLCGFTDPDNRRTYPWGREDHQMIDFHRAAIAMHKRYPVLKRGSLKLLRGAYNILSYGRFSDEQQIAVVFNNNTEEQEVCVPVWQMGVTNEQAMNRVFYTDMEGFSEEILIYPVKAGEITIRMPARSAAVLLAQ
jgi:alpha-glucosidase